jgi:hypothetical protein
VNSPINRVWEFYADIKHVEIQGSEIWLKGKLMISMRRRRSIINSVSPYQYLDEMLTDPFKKWKTFTQIL